jgi:hypothetical protein
LTFALGAGISGLLQATRPEAGGFLMNCLSTSRRSDATGILDVV